MEMVLALLAVFAIPCLAVWLVAINIESREKAELKLKEVCAEIDRSGTNPSLLRVVKVKLGNAYGESGKLILGVNNFFLHFPSFGAEAVATVSYLEITNLQLREPEMEAYIMNLNLSSALANAATKAQMGLELVITTTSNSFTLAGIQHHIAKNLYNEILAKQPQCV